MNLYQPTITGSLSVSGSVNISGSITIAGGGTISGTASYATNAELLDGLDSTQFTLTSSFAAQTASFTAFTSSQNILNGTYATTGSNTFKNPQTINSNLTVTGSITAQTLVVQTVTSSVIYSSGSNVFGNLLANTQTFTGSVSITGSALNVNNGGLFVSSSNNVGINTTNPTSPLTVKAGSRSDTLRLTISGSSSVSDAVGITFGSANYDKAQIIAYNENVGNASGYLTFWTGGSPATTDMTERIRITSAGNVGIGTTSPSEKLHLYNNTAATSTTLIIENNVNNYNCQINFKSIYGGSTAKSFLIGSNISVAAGSWEVYDATAAAARLVISNTGVLTHNASSVSTIVLGASANYTNISSGGYGATLYMNGATRGGTTTSANGAVVLATDAAFYVTDSSTNTVKFQVRGDGLVATGVSAYSPYNFSLSGRDCYINSSGELGYLTSVRESKININDIENVDWLLNLNPVSFNKRKKDEEGKFTDEFYNELDYGLIAEEAELINNQICFYDETESGKIIRGISYTKLITPLLKLVQELNTKFEEYKATHP